MRKTYLAAAAMLAGAVFMPAGASAQPSRADTLDHVQTVSDLAAVCDPSRTGVPRLEAIAYCQGFLTSAGQYHALMHPTGGPVRPLFCVPNPGPSVAEAGIAFASWARANPERGGEPALDGLLRWAQATYPCAAPTATRTRN
jgi:hypothetical protein